MEIPKKLKDEIWEYCRLNNITDVEGFIVRMTQQGYSVEKFGTTPFEIPEAEVVEKEVIKEVEVIKEIPVEVIKEVEKEVIKEVVKEVPVEKIVEKEVVKEVYVTDDEVTNNLQKELDETKVILKNTIQDFDGERKANSVIQRQKDDKIETLNRKISDLTSKISQLELDLEEEKKKPKREKKEIKPPSDWGGGKSAINWVSKEERDGDLYDD